MCKVEKAFYHKVQTTICGDLMICENKHTVKNRARYLLLLLSDFFLKSDHLIQAKLNRHIVAIITLNTA